VQCAALLLAPVASVAARQLSPAIHYYNPDWSPDGRTLLFESTRDGKSAIYTERLDGADLRKLTDAATNSEQPRWSRDGRRIAFISDRDGHLQVYIMNADGSDQRRVTDSPEVEVTPSLSPDGMWIAFTTSPPGDGGTSAICTIRTDGTGRRCLTSGGMSDGRAEWSTDGSLLLFSRRPAFSYRNATPAERAQALAGAAIFLMKSDGSDVHRVRQGPARDTSPVWGPDGRVYFRSDLNGVISILSTRPDGTDPRQVADGTVPAQFRVSPDGTHLTYAKDVAGKAGIYVYDIDSKTERLFVGER